MWNESVDFKFEFVKHEIDIRIESIKNNLDTLSLKLKDDLDSMKKDLIKYKTMTTKLQAYQYLKNYFFFLAKPICLIQEIMRRI